MLTDNKSRNILLDCMKIFAAGGVFIGHYMNTFCEDFVINLRYNNIIIRSLFGFLFMGDYCVVFFFVASGYLLAYYWKGTKNLVNNIYKYSMRLLVPTILIILLTAVIYAILLLFGDGSFNLYNIWNDIRNILFLKFSDNDGIYYGYQLWYIPFQVHGYVICSLIYALLEENIKKKKYPLLILTVLLFSFFENQYAEIMLGVLCGSLCKEYRGEIKSIFYNIYAILLSIILFLLSENIIAIWGNSFDYRVYLSRYFSALVFAFILCIGSCNKDNNTGIIAKIKKISSYTFSFYLVHVLVLTIFKKIYNAYLNENCLNALWAVCIVATTIISSIVYKIIYDKILKIFLDKIKVV